MAKKTKRSQVQEIIKCGKDPNYFFKNYLKIQHPVRGLIPFDTFPFQDECVVKFNEHRFNIVLKSRQLGLSTLASAYSLWLMIFHKDKNILALATTQATARNLVTKTCLLYTSPSPRDRTRSRMPSSA